MGRWMLLGGVAIACAACGGSPAAAPPDAGAQVVAMDARAADLDGPGADATATTAAWSAIYGQLVSPGYPSNCAGSDCHDPGVQKGLDLSTREKGWSTIQHRLSPGTPDASQLISVLKSGTMPQGRPAMPATDIDRIAAWIQAGAQDN